MYEDDDLKPPCGSPECPKPADLFPTNLIPWKIWQIAHQFDRPKRTDFMVSLAGAYSAPTPEQLPSKVLDDLRKTYGEGRDVFERLLQLEDALYPLILERWERNRERGGNGPPGDEEE